MKPRTKRRSTVSRYIEEVCDYEARNERENAADYRYPPIVPKLLLSTYILLKPLPMIFGLFCGLLLARFIIGS